MTNKVKVKSPPNGENMEVGLNEMISEEMHAHRTAPKEDRSDSDCDCNSKFEAALLPCYTINGSEALENQEVFGERAELAKSCGAEWDIFRRQDVLKLMEYLRKHSKEFGHPCGFQKNLKEEYDEFTKFCLSLVIVEDKLTEISFHLILLLEIEPWTFERHVGEAVIIPAGCPYQIRNVKVERMALYRVSAAIKEIHELTRAESSAELSE
ncbi:hypothetical protein PTKIN_Ptkin01aG0128100 [Pterospermum kingtungense]